MANGKLELAWEAIKVHFSSGSEVGARSTMVFLELEGAEGSQKLICTVDQVFLLSNGKYTIVTKLRPGQHFLVDKEGNGLVIHSIHRGAYYGGVHGIVTMAPRNNSSDGHLLLVEGVVVGDFWMQMNFSQLPDSMKEAD
jgi:hypothetical protein